MKNIKHLIVGFLVFTIFFIGGISNSIVANATNKNLSPGIYECENNVKHDSEVGMSMARTYTNKKMNVEIYKDKVEFTIGFSGVEYMKNFRILINGKEASIKNIKKDKDNNTVTLKVQGPDVNSKIETIIYVEPMGRDVRFGVVPNLKTMKLIKKIDEPKSKNDKTASKEEKKESSDNKKKANETDKNKVKEEKVKSMQNNTDNDKTDRNKDKEEKKESENKSDTNEKKEDKKVEDNMNKSITEKSEDPKANESDSKVKYGAIFGGVIIAGIIGGIVIKRFKK